MQQIFVSYSTKDRAVADAVCASLEGSGQKCWIAPRDVLPGTDWSEAIIDAISQSRLMVLIHSDSANHSMQIKREAERAVMKGVTIIPFRIEDVTVSKPLEYHLSTSYWLDAFSPPLEPHLQYLNEVVNKLLGGEPVVGVPPTPERCAECGATLAEGATQCEACGHARTSSSSGKATFPDVRSGRRRSWRAFWSRSLAMKIGAAVVGAMVFFSAGYLWREVGGSSVESHINSAQTYAAKGEFDQAIEELTKMLAANPSYALGYRMRGLAYFQRGTTRTLPEDMARAADDFSMAAKLNPRDDFALFKLSQIQARRGEFDIALPNINRAFELSPRNTDVLKMRSEILLHLKQYDQVIDGLLEAKTLYPSDGVIFGFIGASQIGKGEYNEAVDTLNNAIALNADNPQLYRWRSEAYQKLGKRQEAMDDARLAGSLESATSKPPQR